MKTSEWRVAVMVCAAGAAGCSVASTALGNRLGRDDRARASESRIVTTPNVFAMPLAEAEAAFRLAGFEKPVSVDNGSACGSAVDNRIIELGQVCAQAPAAGQATSARSPITLRTQTENPYRGQLSDGRFWFLMPNFVGVHVDQARAKLRELGFTVKEPMIAYVDRPGCAANIVCETHPEGLRRADNTSDKLLYVGRPPAKPTSAKPDAAKPDPAVPTGAKPDPAKPATKPDIF